MTERWEVRECPQCHRKALVNTMAGVRESWCSGHADTRHPWDQMVPRPYEPLVAPPRVGALRMLLEGL